jgi:hypothetical protein
MPRIVRLSVLTVCSIALVSLGLTGCDSRPADGTQVEVNEVERKAAIDKMRSFMETPKGPLAARKTTKAGRGLH